MNGRQTERRSDRLLVFCQILIFGLGGRGWTERKRRKPRGFGLRPPTPATRRSDKLLGAK